MIKKRLYSFGLVLLLAVSAKLGAYFLIESVLYSNATKITSYEIKEKLVTEIDVTTERLSSAVQRQAKSASLTNSVSRENALQLTDTVYKFRDQFFLSEAFVTNAEGIVVAEASEIANRGDYIFDTTLYGKEVSEGKDTDAVVVHAESLAVHLLEGSPLQSSTNTVIGGLFATQAFDTAYLETVATNAGVSGVAVYTTEGVSASSFSTEQHNLIVDTYFGVVKSLTAATFDVDMISLSGQVYLVYHIPFSELGYRDTNAGLLYFVAQDLSIFVFTALLIGIFLVVLCGIVFGVRFQSGELRLVDGVVMVMIVLAVVIGMLGYLFVYEQNKARPLDDAPFPIYNSTMVLSPTSGVFEMGNEQRISILLESGGEPINAVGAVLDFDPSQVRVEDVSVDTSFCEPGFVIERSIDNQAGEVRISCGSRTPFSGRSAIVGDVIIRPLVPGEVSLALTDESAVFAHDGLGTNVLRKRTSASYQIQTADAIDETIVFSRSHPNSARWYSADTAVFSWRGPARSEYRYLLSKTILDALPDTAQVTTKREISMSPPADGTYYFHLQAAGETQLRRYKINVDRQAPNDFSVKVSDTEVSTQELIRLEFAATDTQSGLETPYYYVQFNRGTFFPVQSPFYTSLPTPGVHEITIRVFDNAGNYRDETVFITAKESIGERFITNTGAAIQAAIGTNK